MIQAWLVYNREDAVKNSYFIDALITYARKCAIDLEFVLREKITLGMEGNHLFAAYKGQRSHPKLVINRSRDSLLAKHLELMGIRVYNSYRVTHLCNHKARTHQFMSELEVPMLDTLFLSKRYFDLDTVVLVYPVVLKSAGGHGGQEVFQCMDKKDIVFYLAQIKEDDFLIQKMCNHLGVDVRVFVLGERILGAIKRESKVDFRSNYSLGGTASIYQLSEKNENCVQKIIKALKSDFVGVDFIVDQQGEFLFNEVEDVVGSRTLYEYGNIDTAKEYIAYIKSTVPFNR